MKYQIRRNIRRESVSSFFTTFDVEFIALMHAKASTVGRSNSKPSLSDKYTGEHASHPPRYRASTDAPHAHRRAQVHFDACSERSAKRQQGTWRRVHDVVRIARSLPQPIPSHPHPPSLPTPRAPVTAAAVLQQSRWSTVACVGRRRHRRCCRRAALLRLESGCVAAGPQCHRGHHEPPRHRPPVGVLG